MNIVCTKVKGEPLYEVVKPLAAHQELIVYYLPERPERPEEMFFVRMRSTLYRRTMDSILEGENFLLLFSHVLITYKKTGYVNEGSFIFPISWKTKWFY